MTLAKDGSFELAASGGELPPGTYLVTMEVNAPKSATGLGKYKGRFTPAGFAPAPGGEGGEERLDHRPGRSPE